MAHKHEDVPNPMPYTKASHLLHPLRRLILSPKKLAGRLNLSSDSRVLELGSGPGYFSLEVARAVTEGKLMLVDVQQEMLNMAQDRLEKKGITNVDYVKADAQCLPLDDQSCDVAFLVAVLGEVPDRCRCLCELHRVLRPDGLLSVTEQPHDPNALPLAEVQRLAQAEGFRFERQFGRGKNYTANFRKS